jgi:hypothetical protein
MSWRWKLYSNAARIPAILRTETRNGMMLELFCYRLLITTSRHSSRDKTAFIPHAAPRPQLWPDPSDM